MVLQTCCCSPTAAAPLLQLSCCSYDAADLLLQPCCCNFDAATLMLQTCCCSLLLLRTCCGSYYAADLLLRPCCCSRVVAALLLLWHAREACNAACVVCAACTWRARGMYAVHAARARCVSGAILRADASQAAMSVRPSRDLPARRHRVQWGRPI